MSGYALNYTLYDVYIHHSDSEQTRMDTVE